MKILLAEDDIAVKDALSLLIRSKGHEVYLAANGIQALVTLERYGPFDAVLTDYQMPRMNGITLIAEIQKKFPKMLVALMSGDSGARVPDGVPFLQKGSFVWADIAAAFGIATEKK